MKKILQTVVLLLLAGLTTAPAQEVQRLAPVKAVTVSFRELAAAEARGPAPSAEPHAIEAPRKVPRNLPVPSGARVSRDSAALPPVPLEATPVPLKADPLTFGFLALGDNNQVIPPDTNGAVGPNHVMTVLNSEVRIQNRGGGVISTVSLGAFWAPTGAIGVFDPRLLYDPISGRWIISAVSNAEAPTSSVLVGGSQTSDPTGLWYLYRFDADDSNIYWADFPSLGLERNWTVVTVNMFQDRAHNYAFGGVKVFVMTRTDLYAGGTLFAKLINTSKSAFTLAPATSYDPPSGKLYLVEDWDGNLSGEGYLRLSLLSGGIGSEIFAEGIGYVKVASTWQADVPYDSAPQLGTVQRIANNDSRIGNCVQRLQSLWCVQSVFLPAGAPTHTAVQWWQFDPVSLAVQQFGRVDDPTAFKYFAFPSIAVNRAGDVLMGYSSFAPDIYASSGFSFRYASDPLNTLRTDKIYKSGEAPYYKTYSGNSNRWGDYSSTVVDPLDDTTMWTLQEYAWTPSYRDRWSTWWLRVHPTMILLPLIAK